MSKLIEALKVIQGECDEHFMCDTCPLLYRDYGCMLDYWGTTQGMQPKEWPIDEVREVEHEK
jgi:hypothetical protein